ncbi:MAG: hypothetical protein ACP5RP_04110 [Candidatus Micrarchaeia archaeon]
MFSSEKGRIKKNQIEQIISTFKEIEQSLEKGDKGIHYAQTLLLGSYSTATYNFVIAELKLKELLKWASEGAYKSHINTISENVTLLGGNPSNPHDVVKAALKAMSSSHFDTSESSANKERRGFSTFFLRNKN